MRLHKTMAAFATIIQHVSPATYQVNVGQNGLQYEPQSTTASAGDQVQFNFFHVRTFVKRPTEL